MQFKTILSYAWKLPLSGILFFIGMALSGILLPLVGFQTPELPAGTDANTITLYFLGGSLVLGLLLSWISRNLPENYLVRWGMLFSLTWIVGGVVMVLESVFFMDTGAVSSVPSAVFTALNFLLPSLALTGAVAWFFPPTGSGTSFGIAELGGWPWKSLAALLAYPAIYLVFGLLVQPLVGDYYTAGLYELEIPTWGQLIPLQLLRSVLLLGVCLPVIAAWRGSRGSLWAALGLSLFGLTAFMAVITAYWFPWQLRLFHGLELFADAMLYAGVLTWLYSSDQEPDGSRITTKKLVLPVLLLVGILPAFLLSACGSSPQAPEFQEAELAFSISLESGPDGEVQGSTWITNQSSGGFPGEDDFLGQMTLWDQNGEPRAGFKVYTLSAIDPGEALKVFTGRWQLDPGTYFLTWGSDPYGGVITGFVIPRAGSSPLLGRTWSIPTAPTDQLSGGASAGVITSFSQREDGSLLFTGRTGLPDDTCLYLMVYNSRNMLDGFPFGNCIPAAEGSWVLEAPLPDSVGLDLGPESGYRALLFSEYPSVPPSEPFQVEISPPQ